MNNDETNKVNTVTNDMLINEEENYDNYENENVSFEPTDYEDDNNYSSNNNEEKEEFKRKIAKLMIFIAIGMFVLFLILFLISKFTQNNNNGPHEEITKLSTVVIKNNDIAESGYGLYKLNNDYVFRGEVVDNFVQLDAKLWRIVKVNPDDTVTLVLANVAGTTYPYDDRYNVDSDYESGINNYSKSRIRESLDTIYNYTNEEEEHYMLSAKDKEKLTSFELCIGKVKSNDIIHNNSLECSQKITSKIGLLTVSDYMNASIDGGCTTPISQSCQNYNYLSSGYSYWLMIANSEDSYSAFEVSGGVINNSYTSKYYGIRPVITLSANTGFAGGSGTEQDPYTVK